MCACLLAAKKLTTNLTKLVGITHRQALIDPTILLLLVVNVLLQIHVEELKDEVDSCFLENDVDQLDDVRVSEFL